MGIQAAIKAEPNYAEAHNNLAGVYQDQRRFDDAIAEYKEAARIHTVPTYVLNVGNAYVNAQRYAEAIPVYEEVQKLDPNSIAARTNAALAQVAWGNQLANSNRVTDAETHYRAALDLNPNYPDAAAGLGLSLAQEGKLQEAGEQFAAANRMRGELKNALIRGSGGIEFGKPPRSPKQFARSNRPLRSSAKVGTRKCEVLNGLGICYAMSGDMANAARQFTEALRVNPNDPAVHRHLGECLVGAE